MLHEVYSEKVRHEFLDGKTIEIKEPVLYLNSFIIVTSTDIGRNDPEHSTSVIPL